MPTCDRPTTQVDISGDGKVDFVTPPSGLVFWCQELFPAFILMLGFQLGSAAIYVSVLPGLDFGTAFYHSMITATTVGYGDVQMATQASRIFAAVHSIISVSWLAQLLGAVSNLRTVRTQQLARAVLLTKPLEKQRIIGLDKDGNGVDKLEFVVGMLMILGVEMCGEPLTWSDVRPFVQKFERLDASGNGAQLCRHEPRRARPTRTHPLVARSFSFLGSRPNLVTPLLRLLWSVHLRTSRKGRAGAVCAARGHAPRRPQGGASSEELLRDPQPLAEEGGQQIGPRHQRKERHHSDAGANRIGIGELHC